MISRLESRLIRAISEISAAPYWLHDESWRRHRLRASRKEENGISRISLYITVKCAFSITY